MTNENKTFLTSTRDYSDQIKHRFYALADAIPQIVWIRNADGSLEYLNKRWYEYTGFAQSTSKDDSWLKIIHPEDFDRVQKTLSKAFETGENYEIEYRFLNPKQKGSYRWHLVRAVPIKNEQGKIERWIGTSTDIHAHKIFEKQKDDFLAITTHELKTPLTVMGLQLQRLKTLLKDNNEKTLQCTTSLEQQIERLTGLINELVDVTKIQKGKLQFQKTLFNLSELLSNIVRDVQLSSTTHHIDLQLDENIYFYGDANRMAQVFINLINNAIKYSPNSNLVEVSLKQQQNEVAITVKDKGIGISEEDLPLVFNQFFRAVKEDSPFEGLGLGLYISHQIVEGHGGRFVVHSQQEKGSEFICFLPLK